MTGMTKLVEIGGVSELGQRYLDGELKQYRLSGSIEPSKQGEIPELGQLDGDEARRWRQTGLKHVRQGEVVFGVLAAGASSRMDLSRLPEEVQKLLADTDIAKLQSKALVPVYRSGDQVLTFLDLFLQNVRRFSEQADCPANTLLLVSEKNRDEIRQRIDRCAEEQQAMSNLLVLQPLEPQIIATVEEIKQRQKNFASDADHASALSIAEQFAGHSLEVRKPAGHGEFLHQLMASGTLSQLMYEGVRYLSIRNIDNVGAVLDDAWLTLLGNMVERDLPLLVEVSQRVANQKGGALIRRSGRWRLAEDPSFAGSGLSATDSYYINNAAAIIRLDYLLPIYETNEAELREAWMHEDRDRLQEIADRGRRRFPTIVEAKPVTLSDGSVVGAITPETNMWESTTVTSQTIGAFGVPSVADLGRDLQAKEEDQQRADATAVRFSPIKNWNDYTDPDKQIIIQRIAQRILEGQLVAPD